MKPAPNLLIEHYRIRGMGEGNNGAFRVPCGFVTLQVIASDGGGWDHVSVSLPERCPTWDEMCHIKDLFFRADEWVMQLHPPKSENINNHAYCLHLWRPQNAEMPLPPGWMVGAKEVTPEKMKKMSDR